MASLQRKYALQLAACCCTWMKNCRKDVKIVVMCGQIHMKDIISLDTTLTEEAYMLRPEIIGTNFIESIQNAEARKDIEIRYVDKVDNLQSASNKQWEGLQYAYKNHRSQYYLVVGTDNYVDIDRIVNSIDLKEKAGEINSDMKFMMGSGTEDRTIQYTRPFILGGGGILLSAKSASYFIDDATELTQRWIDLCDKFGIIDYGLKAGCDVAICYWGIDYGIVMMVDTDIYHHRNFYHFIHDGSHMNFIAGKAVMHYLLPSDMFFYHEYMKAEKQWQLPLMPTADMHVIFRFMTLTSKYPQLGTFAMQYSGQNYNK